MEREVRGVKWARDGRKEWEVRGTGGRERRRREGMAF